MCFHENPGKYQYHTSAVVVRDASKVPSNMLCATQDFVVAVASLLYSGNVINPVSEHSKAFLGTLPQCDTIFMC